MDELKKFIKTQLKQKQKPKDIIDNLVRNGYEEKDAKTKVNAIARVRYLKIIGASIVSAFILLIIILWLYLILTIKTVQIGEIYPQTPQKWVQITADNQSAIDIRTITQGNSYFEDSIQVYSVPFTDITTVFKVNGFYKGEYFDEEYLDANGTHMKISKTMKPGDGVIEGFIVEKINEYKTNNISAFIFVDSDWKDAMPNTKIFYGSRYQYTTDYKFDEISPGIYMFMIYDDPNRQLENFSISYGGIAFGDIDTENIKNDDIVNKTFIRLYS